MRKLAVSLAFLSSCGGALPRDYAAQKGVELPVSRVVMYQSGIGYFERRGRVDGDALTLQVKPQQVNDILKSLTVVDERNGRAVSISLPLDKTGEQALAELPEQVRNASGLVSVLQVFRGARVTLDGKEGEVSGRLLGVETASTTSGQNVVSDYRVTAIDDSGSLRAYPLSSIEKVSLHDRTLEVGLEKSLDVALDEGQWKPIGLTVKLAGESSHELVVSYILEMPLWKPAYRIVVDDKDKPLLQGWAIIDNVSGENWDGVRLSLVAGEPMSFVYDLHAPKFRKRVDLTPRDQGMALAPVIEQPGMAAAPPPAPSLAPSAAPPPSASKRAYSSGRAAPAPRRAVAADVDDDAGPSYGENLAQQVQANTTGASVGALFRYDLQDPVDVPDRSSTLVSIVNDRVPGKEVVLFRPDTGDGGHPYRAVMFDNATGFTLEKGPVAIYAQGTFVGEGFMERMQAGATTFLTYSIDGDVTQTRGLESGEESFKLRRIRNGMLETQAVSVQRQVYHVDNRHKEAVTAMVKSMKVSGATLRNKPTGSVETADAVFVPLVVPAEKSADLKIEWMTPVTRTLSIDTDTSTQVLQLFLSSGKVPATVAGPLGEILKIKARLAAIQTDESELNRQSQLLNDDQSRVRSNLDLLRKTAGNAPLRDSLTGKLAKLEDDLGRLSAKLVRASEERADLNAKLALLIGDVNLEVP